MKTKDQRLLELYDIAQAEDEAIKNEFINAIQPLTNRKVNIRFWRYDYNQKVSLSVRLVDESGEDVFGTEIEINFEVRTTYQDGKRVEKADSKMMKLSKGSIGYHSRLDDEGFHKACDMLLGKIWENEDILTNIYNNISWGAINEYKAISREIDEEKAAIEKAKREEEALKKQQELDLIINELEVGDTIRAKFEYRQNDAKIERITDKCIYLDHYYNSINSNKIRFTKQEVAEFIYNNKELYDKL